MGDLEIAKREVDKELHEVQAKKMELQIWQREAEETLQNRIDSFVKGKEELTAQIQELVFLSYNLVKVLFSFSEKMNAWEIQHSAK